MGRQNKIQVSDADSRFYDVNIIFYETIFSFPNKIRIDETEAETKDRLNNWEDFLEKADETGKPPAKKVEVEQTTTAAENQ